MAGPSGGDVLDAGDVEAGVRDELGRAPAASSACCGSMPRRAASARRRARRGARTGHRRSSADDEHARVGVDHDRVADRGEQRHVVEAVASRPSSRPGRRRAPSAHACDRRAACPGPTRTRRRACRRSTPSLLAVAGGDDVVEAERVGERLHQVVGRRGGEHERADRRRGARRRSGGRTAARLAASASAASSPASCTCVAHPARGEPHGPPGDLHRRPVLAEQVVDPVDELLARDRPVGDPRLLQRLPDDRPRRPPQQRPVQIEERSATRAMARDRTCPPAQNAETLARGEGQRSASCEGLEGGSGLTSLEGTPGGGVLPLVSTTLRTGKQSVKQLLPIGAIIVERWTSASSPPSSPSPRPAASRPPPAPLHTVQSNVSTHVARLERELGRHARRPRRRPPHRGGRGVVDPGPPHPGRARRARRRRRLAARRGHRHRARSACIGTAGRWLVPLVLERSWRRAPEGPRDRRRRHHHLAASRSSLADELDLAVVNLPVDRPRARRRAALRRGPARRRARRPPARRARPSHARRARPSTSCCSSPRGTAFRDELDGEAAAAGVDAAGQGRGRRPAADRHAGLPGLRRRHRPGHRRPALARGQLAPGRRSTAWPAASVGPGPPPPRPARRRRPGRCATTVMRGRRRPTATGIDGRPPGRDVTRRPPRRVAAPTCPSPSPSPPTTRGRCPRSSPTLAGREVVLVRDRRRAPARRARPRPTGTRSPRRPSTRSAPGLPLLARDRVERRRRARRRGRAPRLGHGGPGARPVLGSCPGAAGRHRPGRVRARRCCSAWPTTW